MNPGKKDVEKVTIELPKAVMDFLRRAETDVQTYLQYSLLTIIQSDLNSCEGVWPDKTDIEPILEAHLKLSE
jgi:hypothetical protein